MVFMSLPESYTTPLETLVDAAISSSCTFTAGDFIAKALKLSDKCQLRANHDPKSVQKDSSLHISDPRKKGKKGNVSKKDIECFNCHKKGHFTHNCHGLGGAKEGQQPQKGHPPRMKKSAANAAISIQDGAWSTIVLNPVEILTPNPMPSPSLDDEDIYLDEIPEDTCCAHTPVEPTTSAYITDP